jgi:hydroxymethylbilane synthase
MIIGSRGSRLAMTQVDIAMEALRPFLPCIDIKVKVVSTGGDRDRCTPLQDMGGYGVFTKELDQRLLSGEIDLAINSLKDMPSVVTPGTKLVAVLPRGPVHDVLISRTPFETLAPGAKIGTSSVRRKALVRYLRSDLKVSELRGNVTTRIGKWRRGEYDAIVLAAAGLERIGEHAPAIVLDPDVWVPPAGQGAIALVCRENETLVERLSAVDHGPTRRCVDLERGIMAGLGANCQVPLGVLARPMGTKVQLQCLLLDGEGSQARRWRSELPLDHRPEDVRAAVDALREEWRGLL